MKLHKNVVHFKYSLWVNKKNILVKYSSFFKPRTSWNYLHLDWRTCIDTIGNRIKWFEPRRKVISVQLYVAYKTVDDSYRSFSRLHPVQLGLQVWVAYYYWPSQKKVSTFTLSWFLGPWQKFHLQEKKLTRYQLTAWFFIKIRNWFNKISRTFLARKLTINNLHVSLLALLFLFPFFHKLLSELWLNWERKKSVLQTPKKTKQIKRANELVTQ